jgi:hypothetical protein
MIFDKFFHRVTVKKVNSGIVTPELQGRGYLRRFMGLSLDQPGVADGSFTRYLLISSLVNESCLS